jgi:hypothetical protein
MFYDIALDKELELAPRFFGPRMREVLTQKLVAEVRGIFLFCPDVFFSLFRTPPPAHRLSPTANHHPFPKKMNTQKKGRGHVLRQVRLHHRRHRRRRGGPGRHH